MTSNKGTKKKVKAKATNGRRLKNSREVRLDVEGMQGALWKLFRTSRKWIYKRICSEFNDNLREAIAEACWANQTLGKGYVANSLQNHWDTTSYSGLYKSEAA